METTEQIKKVKELTNQLLDSPKMINDKLPWNSWTSQVEDSENRIAGWIGKIFHIGALLILLALLWRTLEPLWINDGAWWMNAETNAIIGGLLGVILWALAAFPISQIIRKTSDNIISSNSGIVRLVFLELPIALIKLSGYIIAMLGLFAAVSAVLSFVTTLDIPGSIYVGDLFNDLKEMGSLATTALFELLNEFTGINVSGAYNEMLQTSPMADAGLLSDYAWTTQGAMTVFVSFIAVLGTLINLYINVVIYNFLYGLISTLVAWIKAPYLPFKSL
ncbi:MAG: hypothetical protein QNK78_00400 [Crocinitomicaceae bacterium]